ncbi:MAG: hypothetical protein Q7U92_04990, partial [Bradyrhizobium sp.]|nr:hypothetical protein [Bradyrhizobium sp.]
MTRVTTIIALTCFLVVGAAAASILGRDSVPGARLEMAAAELTQTPVSNKTAKQDKLAVVATVALASFGPPQDVTVSEPLRQAYAAAGPADLVAPPVAAPQAPQKPKLVAKPPVQKSYALLSDVQIAGIKERLQLSSSQESYWPAVETALRAIARKIHATRKADPAALIDPDAEEVQQLKSAAMPLLFQLREDQKREVRTLARIIGLEKVASM